jgi:hypothetical protein
MTSAATLIREEEKKSTREYTAHLFARQQVHEDGGGGAALRGVWAQPKNVFKSLVRHGLHPVSGARAEGVVCRQGAQLRRAGPGQSRPCAAHCPPQVWPAAVRPSHARALRAVSALRTGAFGACATPRLPPPPTKQTHKHTHVYLYIYINIYTHTQHTHTHTQHTHTHTHTHTHARTHTHTHAHTHMHTHTHYQSINKTNKQIRHLSRAAL